jgi:predicted HTH domain antitoxin
MNIVFKVSKNQDCLEYESGYNIVMNVMLPAELECRYTAQTTSLMLAIGLFVTEETTLGQSAQVAGMSQAEFLRELGRRRIPIHYGQEDLTDDLQTVDALSVQ